MSELVGVKKSIEAVPISVIHQEFLRRASRIPFLGLGLSVDVYSPDVFELWDELRNRLIPIDYLEIFHAAPEVLKHVRAQLADVPLSYHAEGLWFTQPDWESIYFSESRLKTVARALQILQSHWVNQECATKEINGFALGTYLPPLFTKESAEITAYHAWKAQRRFDDGERLEPSPLLLLEGPPLSFFSMGDISYAEFFTRVTSLAPCGLVLDLGHVWTVYRYTGAWRNQSLGTFFETFLNEFPLERVIQIHIAGLECHPKLSDPLAPKTSNTPLSWIDAHSASIPEELFTLLIQVLQEPRLTNLKGIALEVDGKQIPLICREITAVREMVSHVMYSRPQASKPANEFWLIKGNQAPDVEVSSDIRHILTGQYRDYRALATGKGESFVLPQEWEKEAAEGLADYVSYYLPFEILTWGGDVRVMFPRTCELLDCQGIFLNQFLEFWLTYNRISEPEYDFFLIKIHQFLEFIRHVLPTALSTSQQEAESLSHGYLMACKGS
jgi:uncharacterized protein (UPF0276 family)